MSATVSYVALALAPGVGRVRFRNLIDRFGTAEDVLKASRERLSDVPGIGQSVADAIRRVTLFHAEKVLADCDHLGCSVLPPESNAFPNTLRQIPDPPTLLFVRGDQKLLHRPAVAVVGSRVHTSYGQQVCERLSRAFAHADLVVVSGMAKGLDAVAHWAALHAGGGSVGVLGNGHGIVYPTANRALYGRMLEKGCLVTERPPGERPTAGSFPERNRLISGLARVTLVIEASEKSGALITAHSALEQGKEVMAVPGPITGTRSAGTNRLIQLGAKPVVDPRDVLEEFGLSPDVPQVALPSNLTESERRVIELLDAGVTHVDELASYSHNTVSDLLPVLTALEIRGLVSQARGMHYALTLSFDSVS